MTAGDNNDWAFENVEHGLKVGFYPNTEGVSVHLVSVNQTRIYCEDYAGNKDAVE